MTELVGNVATPCLIVSTFQTSKLSFEALGAMAGATALCIVLFAAIGAVILRAAGLSLRTFLPSISFPNAGNLGLPLSLYAFGPEGLGYGIAYFAISSVANFTLGKMIAAGKANWAALVRQPILYAVLIGVALAYCAATAPGLGRHRDLADRIADRAADAPDARRGAQPAEGRGLRAGPVRSLVRIGMGAAVGIGVATALGLTGNLRAC